MAWNHDVNNTGADTTGAALFRLKALMAAAGWQVRGSGDGLAAFEDVDEVGRGNAATGGAGGGAGGVYDVITQESAWGGGVAGDMGNESAWFRAREPLGTREFLFQRNASFDSFGQGESKLGIFMSPTGFLGVTESPSATVRPTAADEVTMLSPGGLWGASDMYAGALYVHVGVQDVPVDGVYPWFFAATVQGSSVVKGLQVYDALTQGAVSDPQPWVWFTAAAAFISDLDGVIRTYRDYGGGSEAFHTNASAVGYKDANNAQMSPAFVPVQDDGFGRVLPVPIWVPTGAIWRGFLNSFQWKGSATRNYPDTQDLAGAIPRAYIGDLLAPWPQGTAPSA